MARTSKRKRRLESQELLEKKTEKESQELLEKKTEKAYVAGVYARLSVDHQDGDEVSIETQIEMGKTFIETHKDILLYDCYSDLGATGTNFWRSDFERLMQDVRAEKINCVIVKDFSRFGRNYIEVGNFVEKMFPFMGVRFISITDQYDSAKQGINCVIVKDFSRFGRNYIEVGNFVEKMFPFMGVRFISITDQYDSAKQGVNCVIVKDFSRFGRNYIEVGNFVEKMFPFMGVRFISITDQYDSAKQGDCNEALSMHLKNIANELYARDVAEKVKASEALSMHLKNIANELYARDVAEKVKASKQTKRKQGEYLGSVPPYGFRIEKMDGRRTLVRESLTSEIVREIFVRYDSGETVVSIVKWLYEQKIHCPGDYKAYKTVYQQEGQKLRQWRREAIRYLLSNVVYIGNLAQSGKHIREPIIAEHVHEPLVPEEVFCRVGERLEGNRKIQKCRSLRNNTMEEVFRDILYCGECGHKFSQRCSGTFCIAENVDINLAGR